MSAPILQRGDRIHLAIPITQRMVAIHERAQAEKESTAEAQRSYEFLKASYAEMGVEILCWTASQTITVPTVVAVFRGEPEDQ